MASDPKKVLLLEGIHPSAQKNLEDAGYKVEMESASWSGDELVRRAKGFHALGIRSKTQVQSEVIAQLPYLEVIGCFCIGTDQVDLEAAVKKAIPVFNAPYSNTRSVAELVMAETISLSRHLADRSRQMHSGIWQKSAVGMNEIRGKTIGIVGYGHIGSQVSVLAEAFGMNVIYYDIVKKLPLGNAQSLSTLDELLMRADFVTLHVPDTAQTRLMIGEQELKKMKRGSYLINASRGSVVDIPALAESLRKKHLAGAAVDVFPVEPASNKEVFKSELQELENVILTPHIGGSTEEAQAAIGEEVAESFIRYFATGSTSNSVNYPIIDVGRLNKTVGLEQKNRHRIANTHKNVPGVLGSMNSIISQCGGNIVGQHLSTNSHIGYLVTDLEVENAHEVVEKMNRLETSLRTRLIE